MSPSLTLTVMTPRRDNNANNGGSHSAISPLGSSSNIFSFGSPAITTPTWSTNGTGSVSEGRRGSSSSLYVLSPQSSIGSDSRRGSAGSLYTTGSPVQSSAASDIRRGSVGSLYLVSPIEPSNSKKSVGDQSVAKSPIPTSNVQNKPHAFRPPGPTDSRCPCPALNTLANHGYLPHDGKDIPISTFLAALQHPETYHLSSELAHVLAKGGAILIEDSICRLPGIIFKDNTTMSLHDLALHGGVEHDASIVHKNTAPGQKYAPIRTDTHLLNDFIQNRKTIELADVVHRRAELEHVSKIDPVHAEIARGEWALVLDVFGKAHGGKIPADFLREWLDENRFPEGWHPDHKQGLLEIMKTSWKIRVAMNDARKHGVHECNAASDAKLAQELRSDPEGV